MVFYKSYLFDWRILNRANWKNICNEQPVDTAVPSLISKRTRPRCYQNVCRSDSIDKPNPLI
uniref:Bm13455 n=1 Tax=Brugia malayi TaxID=6279 RepID=A0A0J9XUP9_BRUMA|nr:Bm13455 [Brugia malayi]